MILTEQKENITAKLALGFVGLGWIGKNRMEKLIDESSAEVAVICEPTEENKINALQSAPAAKCYNSPGLVFNDESIDGVVIATPSALHATQCIEAFEAGKAVFCQKPLGRTAGEVRDVVNASFKAGKLLAVDLSYRYTEAFQEIYKLLQNGDMGKIFSVDLIFHNAYGPDKAWFYDVEKSGGGCVMDLGIHLVDLALWGLNFPEITTVNSKLYYKGKKIENYTDQVEDFAQVNLLTADDTSINLQCSWNISAGKDAVIEARFYGTEGSAVFKNINGSFYDFVAEKNVGTNSNRLVSPPDDWSGRAGVLWVEKIQSGCGFDSVSAEEFIKTAEVIDKIYGR